MPLLLLDPLVLLLYLGVAAYGWWVWSGRFRSWFGPDRLWLGFWPLPIVAGVVPLLTGPLLRAVSVLGPADDGALVPVIVFLVVNVALIAGLTTAPPHRLLPPWARRRLTTPSPDAAVEAPAHAVPALHASHVQARVTWPRWRWRIDAPAGHAWVVDGRLLFRPAATGDPTTDIHQLDQDEIDQLELQLGDDARLRPPRGGWWTRRRLDVELDELDGLRVDARRPWDRAGLLTLQVEGRRALRLWCPAVDRLRRDIELARQPAPE